MFSLFASIIKKYLANSRNTLPIPSWCQEKGKTWTQKWYNFSKVRTREPEISSLCYECARLNYVAVQWLMFGGIFRRNPILVDWMLLCHWLACYWRFVEEPVKWFHSLCNRSTNLRSEWWEQKVMLIVLFLRDLNVNGRLIDTQVFTVPIDRYLGDTEAIPWGY